MILSEHQKRIDAMEVAERMLQRREQQVAVREDVLREALRAGGIGARAPSTSQTMSVGQWEREVDRMVTEAASRLEPPIAISAFVRALEERAVELEAMYTALERKSQAIEEERRVLAQRQAQVAHKEAYLTRWMEAMEASLHAVCGQEDMMASQARKRNEGEAELLAWTHQLREKEDALMNKERVVTQKLRESRRRETELSTSHVAEWVGGHVNEQERESTDSSPLSRAMQGGEAASLDAPTRPPPVPPSASHQGPVFSSFGGRQTSGSLSHSGPVFNFVAPPPQIQIQTKNNDPHHQRQAVNPEVSPLDFIGSLSSATPTSVLPSLVVNSAVQSSHVVQADPAPKQGLSH